MNSFKVPQLDDAKVSTGQHAQDVSAVKRGRSEQRWRAEVECRNIKLDSDSFGSQSREVCICVCVVVGVCFSGKWIRGCGWWGGRAKTTEPLGMQGVLLMNTSERLWGMQERPSHGNRIFQAHQKEALPACWRWGQWVGCRSEPQLPK